MVSIQKILNGKLPVCVYGQSALLAQSQQIQIVISPALSEGCKEFCELGRLSVDVDNDLVQPPGTPQGLPSIVGCIEAGRCTLIAEFPVRCSP